MNSVKTFRENSIKDEKFLTFREVADVNGEKNRGRQPGQFFSLSKQHKSGEQIGKRNGGIFFEPSRSPSFSQVKKVDKIWHYCQLCGTIYLQLFSLLPSYFLVEEKFSEMQQCTTSGSQFLKTCRIGQNRLMFLQGEQG